MDGPDPQALAEAAGAAMWKADTASRALGMSLDAIGPGRARISMPVTQAFCQGHDTCHGGYIFTLADSAFAFACNSYNQRYVAQHASVTFVAPAFAGDRLTADAVEVTRYGRSGIYDVTVTNQDAQLIASFRGHSRSVKGTHLPEPHEQGMQ